MVKGENIIMEVTEKEALEIYSQRYFKSAGKKRYLPSVIMMVAILVGILLMSFVHPDWLGLIVCIILATPAAFLLRKELRASGKYARKQVEEWK